MRGGLTLREALDITEAIYRTKRLAAVDIVEVFGSVYHIYFQYISINFKMMFQLNPLLGNEYQSQITLDAAKHVLLALFGQSRRGVPTRV